MRPRRNPLQRLTLVACVGALAAVLSGCAYPREPGETKRIVSSLAATDRTLYLAATNLKGLEEWRSELWQVDLNSGKARKLARPRQLVRRLAVDGSGNLLASVVVKPGALPGEMLRAERSVFDLWWYEASRGYRGHRLGEGALVGIPADGLALAYRSVFDAEAAVEASPSGSGPALQQAMTQATTTYLELLGYPAGSRKELSHWTGLPGFELQGSLLVVSAQDGPSLYRLRHGGSGVGLTVLKAPQGLSSPLAISSSGGVAGMGYLLPRGEVQELRTLTGTRREAVKLPPGHVSEVAWSGSGKQVAVTVQTPAGQWLVIGVTPEAREQRTLWSSVEKPRHLTPVGPSSFAIVAGKANEKQTVTLLPEKRALFWWQ